MNIQKVKESDIPPRREEKYTEIFSAIKEAKVGEVLRLNFDSQKEALSVRNYFQNVKKKGEVNITIVQRKTTLFLKKN